MCFDDKSINLFMYLFFHFLKKSKQEYSGKTWYYIISDSQFIYDDKFNHKPITLSTAFINYMEEENLYLQFGYTPKKIFCHTQVQESGSISYVPNNNKTHVNNHQNRSWIMNLKYILYQS